MHFLDVVDLFSASLYSSNSSGVFYFMADIKITKDCYVPKENINFYVGYDSNSVKRDVRNKKKENLVFDYTSGKKILTVVYLKSGHLILSNASVATISQRSSVE